MSQLGLLGMALLVLVEATGVVPAPLGQVSASNSRAVCRFLQSKLRMHIDLFFV